MTGSQLAKSLWTLAPGDLAVSSAQQPTWVQADGAEVERGENVGREGEAVQRSPRTPAVGHADVAPWNSSHNTPTCPCPLLRQEGVLCVPVQWDIRGYGGGLGAGSGGPRGRLWRSQALPLSPKLPCFPSVPHTLH